MISLELKNNNFKSKDKWPLLYVVADVYLNVASEKNPITDVEMIRIIGKKYRLIVERTTIRKYREYLTDYFGFSFKTLRKGHFIVNEELLEKERILKDKIFLDKFKNYDKKEKDRSLVNKISIIQKAIKNSKYLEAGIENYIVFLTKKSKKENSSIVLRKKMFVMAPIEIFRYENNYYLLSFHKKEKQYYIHMVRNLIINKNPITSEAFNESIIEVNLDDYVSKQDFIFTGPINPFAKENFFDDTEWRSYSRSIGMNCIRFQEEKEFSFPYIFQSLIDLYGDKKVDFYEVDYKEYRGEKDRIGIFFPDDIKAESIISKLSNHKDIEIYEEEEFK